MKPLEMAFQIAQLTVLVGGVAAPITWACVRLISVLRDFPPHRHVKNHILYPAGFNPGKIQPET